MKIEVSTDAHTAVDIAVVTETVETGLTRYRDRLTRVEVHLSDVNGPKGGRDARCALEARAAGRQPVFVTSDAETTPHAVKSAIEKMTRQLETVFGRESDVKGGTSASGEPT